MSLFSVKTEQPVFPPLDGDERYAEHLIYLVPGHEEESEIIDDPLLTYGSHSWDFLDRFEGPAEVVYTYRVRGRSRPVKQRFPADIELEHSVHDNLRTVDNAIMDVAETPPKYKWGFEAQSTDFSHFEEFYEPIFISPKVMGIDDLWFRGDSPITMNLYDDGIVRVNIDDQGKRESLQADIADSLREGEKPVEPGVKDVDWENEELSIEEDLIDELEKSLEDQGIAVERRSKGPVPAHMVRY